MSKKIMYKKNRSYNYDFYDYAIPQNLEELKALVNQGFCVMSRSEITERDLEYYFEDWDIDNLQELSESELRELFDDNIDDVSQSLIALALENESVYFDIDRY